MDDQGGAKVSGIWQIVRLKEILQKWQSVTLSPKGSHQQQQHHHNNNNNDDDEHGSLQACVLLGGISPEVSRKLRNAICDSDEEGCGCQTPEPPSDVPKGNLAVYVGQENRRFVIPTSYLGHHLFKVLLDKVEEEYGFDHSGALTIPCETETFKYLLKCIEGHSKDEHEENAHKSDGTSDES